jgi:hypothetical protein
MMQLTIAGADAPAPDPPDVSDPSATVWRDNDDVVVALGQTVRGSHWVHLLRVGAFSFPPRGGGVTAVPDAGTGPEVIEDAFRRMILPLALQAQGHEVLHASAVRTAAGVVALCARSGTGKSTIACALSKRGHVLWADDAVCFELREAQIDALPLPFTLRLRPASAAFFGRDAVDAEPRSSERPEPLAAVFVLERSAAGPAELERLRPADAFSEVLTHAYSFTIQERERTGAMVSNYLELVDRVPVFRLSFAPGLEQLDDLAEMIEEAVR